MGPLEPTEVFGLRFVGGLEECAGKDYSGRGRNVGAKGERRAELGEAVVTWASGGYLAPLQDGLGRGTMVSRAGASLALDHPKMGRAWMGLSGSVDGETVDGLSRVARSEGVLGVLPRKAAP